MRVLSLSPSARSKVKPDGAKNEPEGRSCKKRA